MILPLNSTALELYNAGGKGMNLGKLARAGYPVPGGFVVTTAAYQAFVAANDLEERLLAQVEALQPGNPAALEAASQTMRGWFSAGSLPSELADALRRAYQELGAPPVAVRSSATAEDLPEMSFAGQQDTYLNVVGEEALLQAVLNCWGSLWTGRAIGYRERNGVLQSGLGLAVVVQEMVQSEASGVLFTANPLSGLRSEVVIDATLGLGEALVSGQVEPDHYVLRQEGEDGSLKIVSKKLGAKALAVRSQAGGGVRAVAESAAGLQALPDEQIAALAKLGRRVADEYDFPQDIEWAWAQGRLYLLQTRAITSLYPLPEGLPAEPLRVMASFGAVQGMLDPMTPLGRQAIGAFTAGAARHFGYEWTAEDQPVMLVAGERIFINFTALIRNRIGRKVVSKVLSMIEPSVGQALQPLWDDPRLAPGRQALSLRIVLRLGRVVLPVLARMAKNLRRPQDAHEKIFALVEQKVSAYRERAVQATTLMQQVALMDDMFAEIPGLMLHELIPCFAPAMAMLNLLNHLAADLPDGYSLVLEITRGLPHNVTTQMDLDLWSIVRALRIETGAASYLANRKADELTAVYKAGRLPPAAQTLLDDFLVRYGARGLAEVDLGRPRWADDPTPVLQALQSYLHIEDSNQAPDRVFARGEAAAQAALEKLVAALELAPRGHFKARLARFAASRVRALAGLRELPKFFAVRLMDVSRRMLLESGRGLAAAGLLGAAEDIFFFSLAELRELSGWQTMDGDWNLQVRLSSHPNQPLGQIIAGRRQRYEREKLRRQVPRLLLSDGRVFYEGVNYNPPQAETRDNLLLGDPVSPGVVEGVVHVVFDPHSTHLEPGEILVCRGTDPSWTPLFLSAGGLVTEVGGMMTHGSVVAREYGIPAVVGVHQATRRLQSGQRVRLDGSRGQIMILEED